ncbi:MAG: hypothetical protein OXE99_13050 [Cellvibrionales bacterium]|nr:hypothetical protein [Cellvibrionales bacterium]
MKKTLYLITLLCFFCTSFADPEEIKREEKKTLPKDILNDVKFLVPGVDEEVKKDIKSLIDQKENQDRMKKISQADIDFFTKLPGKVKAAQEKSLDEIRETSEYNEFKAINDRDNISFDEINPFDERLFDILFFFNKVNVNDSDRYYKTFEPPEFVLPDGLSEEAKGLFQDCHEYLKRVPDIVLDIEDETVTIGDKVSDMCQAPTIVFGMLLKALASNTKETLTKETLTQ